jgi:hypothetical protein
MFIKSSEAGRGTQAVEVVEELPRKLKPPILPKPTR